MTGNVKKITTQNQRCQAESHTDTHAESIQFKTLHLLLRLIVTIPEGEKGEKEAWPHLA
jgi:hypothetical protein